PSGRSRDRLGLDSLEEPAQAQRIDFRFAVLTALGGHDVAAEEIPHRLHAGEDAEDGDARVEERSWRKRRGVLVDARRPAGEDDALVPPREDRLDRPSTGEDLGENAHLADPPGDQLRSEERRVGKEYRARWSGEE